MIRRVHRKSQDITRIVKVNISKIRKDHNPVEDVDVSLDPAALASAENKGLRPLPPTPGHACLCVVTILGRNSN